MPPFIYYHIDPFSILVVIEHITLHRYFQLHMYRLVLISLPHSLKSKVRLTSYWIGRWRPCGARTSDHAIAPSNGSRHYGGPYTTGGIIYRVALRDKYSRGSSHYPPPPSTNMLQKPVTIPRNTLTNLTETSTWREADTSTRTTTRHPTRRRITHLIPNKRTRGKYYRTN